MLRDYLENNQEALNAIALLNKVLTALGYVMYPLLLILLYIFDIGMLARCICVPAASFIIVSAFRYIYNAPRPYENGGPSPLIPKSTKGKSFPSRHVFCMFMIAFTWMTWSFVVGFIMFICAIFLAVARVALGVHFARDVIAAFAAALAFSIIGYIVMPWQIGLF